MLCGLVYFFALNWAKLGPGVKLGTIEVGIFGCLLAYACVSAERLSAKVVLLCASTLVGVFPAVFADDSYNRIGP